MHPLRTKVVALNLFSLLVFPVLAHAQETNFHDTTFLGEVISVESFGERSIPETRLKVAFQILEVRLVEGDNRGEVASIENTTNTSFAVGDRLYVHRLETQDGGYIWSAGEPDRRMVLAFLGMLFIAVVVLVAGKAGARALLALFLSLVAIIFGLVPVLSSGAPPVLTSVLFAGGLLVVSMAITHKINKTTVVALLGSGGALVVGALVTEIAVTSAKLSGFISDEATYLHFASGGTADLSGLLLGGILIGVVGVLNDISVSQVHTVEEIRNANPALTRNEVLARAIRVGKEHLAAVVNTLPLAYAGAALPLLLLFASSEAPFLYILNREIFSAEAIRILSGGIALALSGALATWLASIFLVPSKKEA